MSKIWSDLRFASRTLRAKPVFTLIAVSSLALGIGANTAIFSVVDSALLRGLPFRSAEQLVLVRDSQPCCAAVSISPGEYLDYKKQTKTLSGFAAFAAQTLTLTGNFEPQKIDAVAVTTNFFDVLGAKPEIGRLISPNIDKPGSDMRVAVLSDGAWRSLFASDPNIAGRNITLNGNTFRVVGVLNPQDTYPNKTQLWISPRLIVPEYQEGTIPKNFDIAQQYGNHWLRGLGRVKPGVTVAQARAELLTIAANIDQQHPGEKDHHAVVTPLQDSLVQNVRPALWVLLIAVVLLLLIACANLAGLLLARSTGRARELAIRLALGAKRSEVVQLLLSESLLLAFCGGVLGIALALGGLKLIALYSPYDLPTALAPTLDLSVLAFCVVVTLLSALISGAVPALRSARVDVNDALKEGSKGSVGGGTRRLRQVLVGAEIAISLTLLIGVSLLIHSFSKLISVDPGFDPKNVLTARLSLPQSRYSQNAQTTAFWNTLLPRLAGLPDVQSAGLLTHLPFSGQESGSYLEIEGRPTNPNGQGIYANEFGVSPQTFQALRVPLISGRAFTERDDAKALLVAVVNKRFAEKVFPHENPIGKRFKGGPIEGWTTIVGVIGNMKHNGLDDPPQMDMYFNYPQLGVSSTGLVLRTKAVSSSIAAELRSAIHEVDSNLPLTDVKPIGDYIGTSLAARRFLLGLLTTFSALAILLAGIGLYAVLAYSVQQRKQEIGIRMTMGAGSSEILWIVLRECLAIACFGIAAGLVGAIWSSAFLESMLFGVTGADWLSYTAAVSLIVAIAVGASLIPALRASRVDPVSALRYE